MFCPNCGEQLNDGDKFCDSCGKIIVPTSSEQLSDGIEELVAEYRFKVHQFHFTKEELKQVAREQYLLLDNKEIDQIFQLIEEEKETKHKQYLKVRIDEIKDLCANSVIEKMIKKTYPNISESEKNSLLRKIKKALENFDYKEDFEELSEYIGELLSTKAKDIGVKEKVQKPFKRYLSYTWKIIINIITLGVIFAILNSSYQDSQKVTYSLLILIYLTIKSALLGFGFYSAHSIFKMNKDFLRIRELLSDELSQDEKVDLEKSQKILDTSLPTVIIGTVFNIIFYIVTLLSLFSSL